MKQLARRLSIHALLGYASLALADSTTKGAPGLLRLGYGVLFVGMSYFVADGIGEAIDKVLEEE